MRKVRWRFDHHLWLHGDFTVEWNYALGAVSRHHSVGCELR